MSHVKILAHENLIICCPDESLLTKEHDWWVPTDTIGNMGCVVMDSAKNLSVSSEALDLMKLVSVGHDSVGDIDWWACNDGNHAFSWWGPIFRVIDVNDSISARGFRPSNSLPFTEIPNELPLEVLSGLELMREDDSVAWRQPFAVEKVKVACPACGGSERTCGTCHGFGAKKLKNA